jgi:uncharacterized protein YukE
MTINPLVVPRIDQPSDFLAGVWIAEDIQLIVQGIQTGSWVDASIGSISAALDGLAFVADPFSGLLQYFAAALMEHFGPLREALDWLAGDPGQIAGHAQSWRNVSASLATQYGDLRAALNTDIATWSSEAGAAYRAWAQLQHSAIDGLAKAAEAMAVITECAGTVVATVRVIVRDLIAIAFSRAVTYITEEVFSLGFATPVVAAQLSTLVLACGARITRLMHGLVNSLARLSESAGRLSRHIDELTQILGRVGIATTTAGKATPLAGGFLPPAKGSPEWLQRQHQLSADPAKGTIGDPDGLREAEVALDMEARGVLSGPIQRAPMTYDAQGNPLPGGDFVDATGREWDVKQAVDIYPPPSPDQGRAMPPGEPRRFDPLRYEDKIAQELAKGEFVIIDTQFLSAAGRADLQALIASHPEWAGKVYLH